MISTRSATTFSQEKVFWTEEERYGNRRGERLSKRRESESEVQKTSKTPFLVRWRWRKSGWRPMKQALIRWLTGRWPGCMVRFEHGFLTEPKYDHPPGRNPTLLLRLATISPPFPERLIEVNSVLILHFGVSCTGDIFLNHWLGERLWLSIS